MRNLVRLLINFSSIFFFSLKYHYLAFILLPDHIGNISVHFIAIAKKMAKKHRLLTNTSGIRIFTNPSIMPTRYRFSNWCAQGEVHYVCNKVYQKVKTELSPRDQPWYCCCFWSFEPNFF